MKPLIKYFIIVFYDFEAILLYNIRNVYRRADLNKLTVLSHKTKNINNFLLTSRKKTRFHAY